MEVFQGVKIADFTWVAAGPILTCFLADQGATVVRIESIHKPDMLRTQPPFKGGLPGINRSGIFAIHNCNKFSLSLNMNHPRGMEIARRMIAWADVVAENFTAGTMEKWGLGYEDLKKIKPDIIMISTCNQGQKGPHSRHPGLGQQMVSLAGFTELTGWPDRDPALPFGAYTDLIAPPLGAAALIAALEYRRKTGKGLYLDLSQFEAALYFLAPLLLDYEVNGREASRMGNRCPYAAPHGVYPCRGEDRWCAIAVFTDQEWRSFCRVLGNPPWTQEERFATLLGRKKNEDELDSLVAEWTLNHRAEEVMERLQQAGVAAGVVQNAQDLHLDPQLLYRHHFWELEHLEMGVHRYNALAFHLSASPAQPRRAAPCLGQDNEYVLKELLDMSEEEYVDLLLSGVLE